MSVLIGSLIGAVTAAGALAAAFVVGGSIVEGISPYLEQHPELWDLPGILIYGLPGLVIVTVIVVLVFRGRKDPGLGAAVGGAIGYCSVWALEAATTDVTGLWIVGFVLLVPGVTVGLILVWLVAQGIYQMRSGAEEGVPEYGLSASDLRPAR
ncbi:hypothetical protein M0E87_07995 [Corynebacterium sp. CCM 9185]|uniref:DUF5518 domain-containing protein n=1 Tax=Corynebacterium marambiense TaxID=2765364 RepID=A0ABS0VU04_9CORY|nr:hypothetical protein [Corynebacterium marambiense]MBI9000248.1 hypothetical protein [Corynebacterium marambiense]MCK7663602.1 hypothetical protein [Corynebacterium marambiense]MCX7541964.1 hypothetical protein [Corynebacterium marambiense]